jgi:hypothetical protein
VSLPGWNDLEAVKKISSGIADTTVFFWALMVLFESSALVWKRRQKLLAGIGFAALVLALAGEIVGRKYEHRKDFLYDEREANTARKLNAKIDAANAAAETVKAENESAKKQAVDATKTSIDAEKRAQKAQNQADELRKQQAPRTLTKEQQQKLSSYLSKCPPGAFEINASINENDARPYAEQIASLFRNNGWSVKIHNSMFTGPDISGLWLTIQDPQRAPRAAVDLNNALAAAGMSNRVEYDPTFTDPVLVTLSIGFKPKAVVGKP